MVTETVTKLDEARLRLGPKSSMELNRRALHAYLDKRAGVGVQWAGRGRVAPTVYVQFVAFQTTFGTENLDLSMFRVQYVP